MRPTYSPKYTAVRGKRQGLSFWLVLAALVHIEVGGAAWMYLYFFAPRGVPVDVTAASGEGAESSVELSTIDEETSRKIVAEMEQAQERLEAEEKKKEEESPKIPGQVVELARPTVEERPKDARFTAEYDSTVAKQTRRFGELNPNAVQGKSDGNAAQNTPEVPEQAARPQVKGSPGARSDSPLLAMRPPGPENTQPPSPRPPGSGPDAVSGQSNETEAGPPEGDGRDVAVGVPLPPRAGGGGAGRPNMPGVAALMPSSEQVARAIGSGTKDHLDDVDEGDETSLNAKKWKFASFFNRVKKQVRIHWNPAEVYQRRDPSFRIYGQRDRFTMLRVQLKPDGALSNVALETPSGIEFLDDEAIEAFKQAQPFPNPPRQLIEDGAISFRFGFYFEIGGLSPRVKVFRYNDF